MYEAIEFNTNNWEQIKKFTNNQVSNLIIEKRLNGMCTCTLENEYTLYKGNIIMKGLEGDLWAYSKDQFYKQYDICE